MTPSLRIFLKQLRLLLNVMINSNKWINVLKLNWILALAPAPTFRNLWLLLRNPASNYDRKVVEMIKYYSYLSSDTTIYPYANFKRFIYKLQRDYKNSFQFLTVKLSNHKNYSSSLIKKNVWDKYEHVWILKKIWI